jgi:hypothetical protein
MKIFVEVTDIEWDTDGEEVDLPTEIKVEIPTSILIYRFEDSQDLEQEIDDYVSDEISNISGFCHTGYNIN